jgi:hypothetical protein
MVARWSGCVSEVVVRVVREIVVELVYLEICGDFPSAGLLGAGE